MQTRAIQTYSWSREREMPNRNVRRRVPRYLARTRARGVPGCKMISGCKLYETVFSFLYLKKIKILKIYVRFGKFQKYTPVALWGGDRAQM